MTHPDLLRCRRCGAHKPTTEFHRKRSAKRGYAYECKPCASLVKRQRYQALLERLEAAGELDTFRERQRAYGRAHYAEHHEVIRVRNQRWWAAHPLFKYADRLNIKASKAGMAERITTREIETLWEAQAQICPLTLKPLDITGATGHHLLHLSRGGQNVIRNVVFVDNKIPRLKLHLTLSEFCKQAALPLDKIQAHIAAIHAQFDSLMADNDTEADRSEE